MALGTVTGSHSVYPTHKAFSSFSYKYRHLFIRAASIWSLWHLRTEHRRAVFAHLGQKHCQLPLRYFSQLPVSHFKRRMNSVHDERRSKTWKHKRKGMFVNEVCKCTHLIMNIWMFQCERWQKVLKSKSRFTDLAAKSSITTSVQNSF